MKTKQILMLTTAALCGLAATRAGAEAVATTPMGYTELRLPGDGATTLLGINLIGKPPYAGRASAVGENTVTVDAADLSERLTDGRFYALLITSGANAGANTLVTGREGQTLILQESLEGVLTPEVDGFQLQALPTIAEIFGVGGDILAGGTATSADRVTGVHAVTGELVTLFYSTGGITGVGWRGVGKGGTSFDDMPIYFTDGLSVQKKSAGEGVLVVNGAVHSTPIAFPISAGFRTITNVYAASSTLGNSDLFRTGESSQSLDGGSATTSDQVRFDADGDGSAEIYFYSTGGITGVGWRRVGGGATPQDPVALPSAFNVKKRAGTAEITRQPPYDNSIN